MFESLKKQLSELENADTAESSIPYEYNSKRENKTSLQTHLLTFDPNTIGLEDWKKLGLSDRTIRTIQNFKSKGGKFRKPEDIGKIYGMRKELFETLLPYVNISKPESHKPDTSQRILSFHRRKPEIVPFDINTADTSLLIALPGIGSKLANRIIGFRDKLGGFYSIAQVKETYGLTDSTFLMVQPYLLITSPVKMINLNTAGEVELKNHPYIRWTLAKTIISYREQHGRFKDIADLHSIKSLAPDVITKLQPYLSFD